MPVSRTSRTERVAQLLREEISTLILREIKDPRVRMASISEVRITGDLKRARVRVSVIGEDGDRHRVIKALQHAEGFLRAQLSQRLENLHTAPRLIFELDESIAYSVHMTEVMKGLEPSNGRNWPPLSELADDIRAAINNADSIGCLAHKDADADSLGSALAFALSLRETGKKVTVVVPEPKPLLIEYLPGFETTVMGFASPIDLLFTFDCASIARFGNMAEFVEECPSVINIDHHASSHGFGNINLIDVSAAATGQVVYDLINILEMPVTKDVATNLYAALFTDTGGFRHDNTNEATLRLGANLLSYGVDAGWVATQSYKSRSESQLRLEGMAIAALTTEMEGRLVYSEVTLDMLAEAQADAQESEGVIDHLQSIGSMEIALLFKETNSHNTKLSVRTRGEHDASKICEPFGGGGHYRAAGAELHHPLATAREEVLRIARAQLAKAAS